ncbi:hypothetical protein B0H13DRAFT_2265218 [Mycena leptocephala]|nr:hypothetical protein B0H13DRAFT_2265218 [Mycena leptocephala]
MCEGHDLHHMLSNTTADPRRPMTFDVVLRTRNCDDTSTDREYNRRKIDSGNGEVYISLKGEPPRVLARRPRPPAPAHRPRLALHPHPHHYDPVTVPTNPPFSLDPALHLPDARRIPHHNGTSAPALHLPDSPPGRATYDERDHGAPLSQPYAAHTHIDPDAIMGTHPHPHSPVDINGHAHPGLDAHEHAHDVHEHDSWRPYAETERARHRGQGWGRRSARLLSLVWLPTY